ncbi:MAG: transposase [Candidatus Dojkabacteria bacterium]
MSRQNRNFIQHSYYHVFNRCNNKEMILQSPSDKQIFVHSLYKYIKDTDLRLIAFCIMDNHFHLILKTGKELKEISKYMQKVITSFAMQINRKYKRVGHIFQGRYNANLLYWKKDLLRATEYIKQNPVVDGLVKKPSEYPWSKY